MNRATNKAKTPGRPPSLPAWRNKQRRRKQVVWLIVLVVGFGVAVLDRTVGLWPGGVGRHRAVWHGQEGVIEGPLSPGGLLIRLPDGQRYPVRLAALLASQRQEHQIAWSHWVQERASGRRVRLVVERWIQPVNRQEALPAGVNPDWISGDLVWLDHALPAETTPQVPRTPQATLTVAQSAVRAGVLPPADGLPPETAYLYRLLQDDARKAPQQPLDLAPPSSVARPRSE